MVLIGCGAMGAMQASIMVRGGVGRIRIVDRDVAELDNLQRQVLFDEIDVADGLPKAEAAWTKLSRINSEIVIEAKVVDVGPDNIDRLIDGTDLILDGTDNFETRYVINDAAMRRGIPWVFGGVVADRGNVMPIIPGQTPCLRCMFPDPPGPDDVETCRAVGVLASAVAVVASLQTVEAIKILTGRLDALNRVLVSLDIWTGRFETVPAGLGQRRPNCPACGNNQTAK